MWGALSNLASTTPHGRTNAKQILNLPPAQALTGSELDIWRRTLEDSFSKHRNPISGKTESCVLGPAFRRLLALRGLDYSLSEIRGDGPPATLDAQHTFGRADKLPFPPGAYAHMEDLKVCIDDARSSLESIDKKLERLPPGPSHTTSTQIAMSYLACSRKVTGMSILENFWGAGLGIDLLVDQVCQHTFGYILLADHTPG